MAKYSNINDAVGDLNLWFKNRSGDELTLADVPKILPLRWNYFVDNFEFITNQLEQKIPDATNPDLLNLQIQSLSEFISQQRTIPSILNPFSDTSVLYRFYEVFDNMNIQDINMTKQEQNIVSAAKQRVNNFTRNNFLDIRAALVAQRDLQADLVGGTDATYNEIFSRSPTAQQRVISISDISGMDTIEASIKSVDFILANSFAISANPVDPFLLARQNANNPDITIGDYSSGTLVRFTFGQSLEQLALQYLGNPDSWIDIAIANGLKPPYIDEIGEALAVTANGRGNQLVIAAKDASGNSNINKLFINQQVIITSVVFSQPDARIVLSIREVPVSGEIILEVSGDEPLDKYKLNEGTSVRVFKPNTINSNLFILIPSNDPIDTVRPQDTPWFLKTTPEDEKRALVDLLINDAGDLQYTQGSDLMLSYGIANAVQALRLKVSIELAELQKHQNFGLFPVQGTKNASSDAAKAQIVNSINNAIEQDPRFDRIENLTVTYITASPEKGNASMFFINLRVRLANGGTIIPITFTVNNVG